MFNLRFKKTVAGVLSVFLLGSNGVFAHAQETNSWGNRKNTPAPQPIQNSPWNLSPRWGSIRRVFKPTDSSNGKVGPVVLHIQDIHGNFEAETEIAAILKEMGENKNVRFIALEGATGAIDVSAFRKFPHQEIIEHVAADFLQKNKLSGPLYAALTAKTIPPLIGVDDEMHYQANVEAYRASLPLNEKIKQAMARREQRIASQKRSTLNPELLAFDTLAQAYRDGQINMGIYAEKLATYQAVDYQLSLFLQAVRLERSLNFNQVERERAQLLEHRSTTDHGKQLSRLLELSNAYRSGDIAPEDFYRALGPLSVQDAQRYPQFERYLNYVFLSGRIDSEKLLQELQRLESSTYNRLARTESERRLIRQSQKLDLTKKLIEFALTRDEWDAYKTNAGAASLKPFETFYREAEARDRAMAENLLRTMQSEECRVKNENQKTLHSSFCILHSSLAVLITGGFHSTGIDRRLVDAGCTVVTFVPKITKIDSENGSVYLSALAREKTPLDKLFAGEKLFLAGPRFPDATRVELAIRYVGLGEVIGIGFDTLRDCFQSALHNWKLLNLKTSGMMVVARAETQNGNVINIRFNPENLELSWTSWDRLNDAFQNWWRRMFRALPSTRFDVATSFDGQSVHRPRSEHEKEILTAVSREPWFPHTLLATPALVLLGCRLFSNAFPTQGLLPLGLLSICVSSLILLYPHKDQGGKELFRISFVSSPLVALAGLFGFGVTYGALSIFDFNFAAFILRLFISYRVGYALYNTAHHFWNKLTVEKPTWGLAPLSSKGGAGSDKQKRAEWLAALKKTEESLSDLGPQEAETGYELARMISLIQESMYAIRHEPKHQPKIPLSRMKSELRKGLETIFLDLCKHSDKQLIGNVRGILSEIVTDDFPLESVLNWVNDRLADSLLRLEASNELEKEQSAKFLDRLILLVFTQQNRIQESLDSKKPISLSDALNYFESDLKKYFAALASELSTPYRWALVREIRDALNLVLPKTFYTASEMIRGTVLGREPERVKPTGHGRLLLDRQIAGSIVRALATELPQRIHMDLISHHYAELVSWLRMGEEEFDRYFEAYKASWYFHQARAHQMEDLHDMVIAGIRESNRYDDSGIDRSDQNLLPPTERSDDDYWAQETKAQNTTFAQAIRNLIAKDSKDWSDEEHNVMGHLINALLSISLHNLPRAERECTDVYDLLTGSVRLAPASFIRSFFEHIVERHPVLLSLIRMRALLQGLLKIGPNNNFFIVKEGLPDEQDGTSAWLVLPLGLLWLDNGPLHFIGKAVYAILLISFVIHHHRSSGPANKYIDVGHQTISRLRNTFSDRLKDWRAVLSDA